MCLAVPAMALSAACLDGSKLALNQQADAHKVSSHLHVQFSRAAEASNRAVMADTDDASAAAAGEARQATDAVARDIETLHALLQDLNDRDELQLLDAFSTRFTHYRALDADILPLAVENTNLKAQRLSFGPAQEAVSAFRHALEGVQRSGAAKTGLDAPAATAIAALLEVQVLEARHIAESDEAAMTKMEEEMGASETAARKALDAMKGVMPPAAAPGLATAGAALDRFTAVNAEIVKLSRRNSNVRSLALSLGKKRTVTAECDEFLQSLEETLAKHHFTATR